MFESTFFRFGLIAAIALAAHLATVVVRRISRRLLRSRMGSEAKVLTVTGFATSLVVFGIYFAAVGFVLTELGVSLTTYLASASVIGLAVSFGSQGIVQDVITGLTVVFSDLIDIGDMVDIGGQVGIVESVGMRFSVLVNFAGARVFVPNRSITNVINYPKGYSHAFMDVRLPGAPESHDEAERRLGALSRAFFEQYPGILLLPPTVEGRTPTVAGYEFIRIKFRIWPGQFAALERAAAASVAMAMRDLDPSYADWMVHIHYRSEPPGDDPRSRLPQPAAVRNRVAAHRRDRESEANAQEKKRR